MEPIVIFSVGLVAYCGYLTFMDELRDWQKARVPKTRKVRRNSTIILPGKTPVSSSGRCREGGAGAHWPALLKGSA